tara:strand:+ start:85 stop:327 length:243 start_codon:yes stop_codon:yes gene_type:complete
MDLKNKIKIDHNLYDLLGQTLIKMFEDGKIKGSDHEQYFKDLMRLQLSADVNDQWNLKLETGPSDMFSGRDYKAKITRSF